jgi:hypothetical protein
MQRALRQPAATVKSSHFRWIAILLCLTLAASGILQVGGAFASPETVLSAASEAANPADGPCEQHPAHGEDECCTFAAGCASYIDAQQDIAIEPVSDRAVAGIDAEFFRGAAAVPQAPPPKFTAQV